MRCAVLGGELQGLSLAVRLASLKHDVWMVANSAEHAQRCRQELGDKLVCTINASYAVKRADVLFLANGGIHAPIEPVSLAEWLKPKVSEHILIVITADVAPGTTSMLRRAMMNSTQFSGSIVYMPPVLLHRPLPLVLGTEDGERCDAMERVLYYWPRIICKMRDSAAEYVQCFAHRRLSTYLSVNSREEREAYMWWREMDGWTMLDRCEQMREPKWFP